MKEGSGDQVMARPSVLMALGTALTARLFVGLLFLIVLLLLTHPSEAGGIGLVRVAVFDAPKEVSHARNVLKFLEANGARAKFALMPIYSHDGHLLLQNFVKGLKSVNKSYDLVHLSWNQAFSEEYTPIVRELQRIIDLGIPVVASSGESQDREVYNLEIAKTVMGKVKDAILIGELDQKGKLKSRAYFGPEIFISIPERKSYPGSSFTAAAFTNWLIRKMNKPAKESETESKTKSTYESNNESNNESNYESNNDIDDERKQELNSKSTYERMKDSTNENRLRPVLVGLGKGSTRKERLKAANSSSIWPTDFEPRRLKVELQRAKAQGLLKDI